MSRTWTMTFDCADPAVLAFRLGQDRGSEEFFDGLVAGVGMAAALLLRRVGDG